MTARTSGVVLDEQHREPAGTSPGAPASPTAAGAVDAGRGR